MSIFLSQQLVKLSEKLSEKEKLTQKYNMMNDDEHDDVLLHNINTILYKIFPELEREKRIHSLRTYLFRMFL